MMVMKEIETGEVDGVWCRLFVFECTGVIDKLLMPSR